MEVCKISKEKTKPYLIVILISIILLTAMSIGVFVIFGTMIRDESTRYSITADKLDNFGSLAEADIQIILEEDSVKYDTAYSYLNDLYSLNGHYMAMLEYNVTHPLNYTQQDFDEVKMEFTIKMRILISIVQSTSVYDYSVNEISADVTNNYTYLGYSYFFIINKWYYAGEPHEAIHSDIKNHVNTTFTLTGDTLELPEIKLENWAYCLYNNLSILESFDAASSIGYAETNLQIIDYNLVNLSLAQVFAYRDGYSALSERADDITQDFNNILITLAMAGVLMGFATSFENDKFRKISLVVGLIVLFIAIMYFSISLIDLVQLPAREAGMIKPNAFVFA